MLEDSPKCSTVQASIRQHLESLLTPRGCDDRWTFGIVACRDDLYDRFLIDTLAKLVEHEQTRGDCVVEQIGAVAKWRVASTCPKLYARDESSSERERVPAVN